MAYEQDQVECLWDKVDYEWDTMEEWDIHGVFLSYHPLI